MTFTINEEYSKLKIKAPRNSVKIHPKLAKNSKQHDTRCCGIHFVKYGQVLHPLQCF